MLKEKFEKIKELLESDDFLKGHGLSNEVNIRIMCYNPREKMQVDSFVQKIKRDYNVNVYNLYHVFLNICKDKRIIGKIDGMEKKRGKDFLLKQLQKIASPEEYIKRMSDNKTIVITGVGEVYPFLELHQLLNCIQIYNVPIIAMFPGTYDWEKLFLFGSKEPRNYYRAFNVV